MRERGVYGIAVVTYHIISTVNTTDVSVDSLFVSDVGQVLFDDLQFNAELTVNVLNTGVPHFDLQFVIQLLNVTGISYRLTTFCLVICLTWGLSSASVLNLAGYKNFCTMH